MQMCNRIAGLIAEVNARLAAIVDLLKQIEKNTRPKDKKT